MLKHPAEPRDPLHHLLELFDPVAEDTPAIRNARGTVERIELLRTMWLRRPISEWPKERPDLEQLMSASTMLIVRILSRVA